MFTSSTLEDPIKDNIDCLQGAVVIPPPKGDATYIDFLAKANRMDEAKSTLSMVRQKFPKSNSFDNIALS